MFVKETVIGREIHPDDHIEDEKDDVLYQLYQFHYNIFNPKDVPMTIKRLSQAVRMDEKRVEDICGLLEDEKLIKRVHAPQGKFYKITPKGIQYVEKEHPAQEFMIATRQ